MILLSLSIIGFILSAIFLYFNARKFPFPIILGAFFFLISLLLALATALPYIVSSWADKTPVSSEIITDLNYLMIDKPTVIHHLIPDEVFYLSRDLLIFVYLIFFALLLVRYLGLLISPYFYPEILYGLPRILVHYLKRENESINHLHQNPIKRIVHLESAYIHLIGQKVDQCMIEHQPYLQKDFNLAELSVLIHIPIHHLAIYFREERQESFSNYRNHWRIEYAKNLLDEGKAKELTLEAIGMLSGFTNRNSFIIAFKRFEGDSPHQYLTHECKHINA